MKNVVWKGDKDITVIKDESLKVMEHHANKQIESLREHAELLIIQAETIQERVDLAKIIANAEYGFKPVQLNSYHLYRKGDRHILTLIAPNEWDSPYDEYIAEVRQLGDSTWEKIIEEKDNE